VEGVEVGERVNCWNTRLPPEINAGWAGHVSRSVNAGSAVVKVPDRSDAVLEQPGPKVSAPGQAEPPDTLRRRARP